MLVILLARGSLHPSHPEYGFCSCWDSPGLVFRRLFFGEAQKQKGLSFSGVVHSAALVCVLRVVGLLGALGADVPPVTLGRLCGGLGSLLKCHRSFLCRLFLTQ